MRKALTIGRRGMVGRPRRGAALGPEVKTESNGSRSDVIDGRGQIREAGAGLELLGTTRGLKGIRAYRMMDSIHFESAVRGGCSVWGPLQFEL